MQVDIDRDNGRRIFRFRQSWLNTYQHCPEQARLDMRGELPRIESDATAIGTAMHLGIETMIAGGSDSDAVQAAYDKFDELSLLPEFNWKQVRTRDTAHRTIYNALWGWYDFVWPQLGTPITVEQNFKVQIDSRTSSDTHDELWICGTWDFEDESGLWDWKGLALDTRLPTPTGWTTMADVREGDYLLGSNGLPTRVIGKSNVKHEDCYEVTFRDGSVITTDASHLWTVTNKHGTTRTVSTPEMAALQRPWHIAAPDPIVGVHADLPIDPYLLGLWLGDGTTAKGREVSAHPDDAEAYAERFIAAGFDDLRIRHNKSCSTLASHAFGRKIREAGLEGRKVIPSQYLRASVAQRMELLRGLMDTDGTWNAHRDQACFDNTNFELSDAVGELVASMGWSYSVFDGCPSNTNAKPFRRITFTPSWGNPFWLKRKADLVPERRPSKASRRYVTSVRKVDSVPTQCVSVDAHDNLYLAGPKMVPTHNTAGRPYEQWEVDRWYIQPTVYTLAHSIINDCDPVDFNYGIAIKSGALRSQVQTLQVQRTEGHFKWLKHQCWNIINLWDATDGGSRQWPLSDSGWWCSSKWCSKWGDCKGKFIEL